MQTFSPPYKDSFSKKENDFIINLINDFQPNILFVGMTAPRQEKWVYSNKERLSANIICSIGAVFDFFAGTQKRAGRLWLKFNLEWLYRLLNNPFRLYKRTFISLPQFLFYTLLNKKKI